MSEEKKEEEQPQKEKKERKERAPKRRVKVYTLYKLEDEKLLRVRKECPRCGRGYFMAEHKDRSTCGNCGFTVYKSTQKAR
jgi:small subunit ribosomal protein S27Ae